MENKKVSFGFRRVTKKPEIVTKAPKYEEKQVELIDCLEGQSIKIKDAVEEIKQPLIIPIKESTKNLIDRVKEAKEKRIKNEIKQEESEVPDSELTVDELVARELIREAKNRDKVKNESKIYSLPLKEEKLILEGEPEPSLEDYDNVPISDYGMAMLRGMGWKEGMGIGKTHTKTVTPIIPELRPKGLGLGANKMATKLTKDKDGKELQICKGGFGKIIDGRHKGHYCEIQGVDMETSRCIVKISIINEILSLHEYLIVPVTKEEYGLGSKILNNAKYEEYKEKSSKNNDYERSGSEERLRSNGRNRSTSRDKHRRKKSPKKESDYSDSENDNHKSRKSHKSRNDKSRKSKMTSGSEGERRRKSKKKHKSRYKSSDSGGSDDDYKKHNDKRHGR